MSYTDGLASAEHSTAMSGWLSDKGVSKVTQKLNHKGRNSWNNTNLACINTWYKREGPLQPNVISEILSLSLASEARFHSLFLFVVCVCVRVHVCACACVFCFVCFHCFVDSPSSSLPSSKQQACRFSWMLETQFWPFSLLTLTTDGNCE